MKSWDGWANEGGYVMREKTGTANYTIPVRVTRWECPYPQEQVPQVNEEVKLSAGTYVVLTPPYAAAKVWSVRVGYNGRFDRSLNVQSILKVPAPTVEVGGRRLLESEAVECCKALEPVESV